MQPLQTAVWRFLKKLKIELPYHPAVALLGIQQKNTKILIQRDTCTPVFIAALSTIANYENSPRPLTDEWIKKRVKKGAHTHTHTHTHTHSGILLSNQKNAREYYAAK